MGQSKMDLPLFPKPHQVKKPPVTVRVFKDGRENCNLLIKSGRHEYQQRKRTMWERQARVCCYYGYLECCPGKLNWSDTVFAHETPRGYGGSTRDDRIEIDGRRVNGAAHAQCNVAAGSRRIPFNAPHNRDPQ
jgi:hypothetical protein